MHVSKMPWFFGREASGGKLNMCNPLGRDARFFDFKHVRRFLYLQAHTQLWRPSAGKIYSLLATFTKCFEEVVHCHRPVTSKRKLLPRPINLNRVCDQSSRDPIQRTREYNQGGDFARKASPGLNRVLDNQSRKTKQTKWELKLFIS